MKIIFVDVGDHFLAKVQDIPLVVNSNLNEEYTEPTVKGEHSSICPF